MSEQSQQLQTGLLTAAQVAKLLNIHRDTVYRLVKESKLPGQKIGGMWRFNRQAILSLWTEGQDEREESSS